MRFHHYGIEVSSIEDSILFYKKSLGFVEESRMFFEDEQIVFLRLGDFRLELIAGKGDSEKNHHFCFEVNEFPEVMTNFRGFRIIEGPFKLQNGWQIVFFEGPDREIIELLKL
ncbi:VOC family protein [Neobacillus kokaensis]|uniref:VOC domain-containing protein n=1 Tax=Neobacillus kokaensis TaxID=2759023 RepID=A0ABQ3N699_9BACI|nr:VOC family protein [Neobacillus kokaensis]GHI00455.1 hypothetical protein AM1BK_39970 [Neobacillus kokaensis]